MLTDQFNKVGFKYGVRQQQDDGDGFDFTEAMFIIDEYGKLKFSSLLQDVNDMSVKKTIDELLAYRNGNQF